MNAIVPVNLDTAAPPPLSPLQDVIISPANVEIEKRRKVAVRLTRRERRLMRREIGQLRSQLKRIQFYEVAKVYRALRPRAEYFKSLDDELLEKLQASPDDPILLARRERLYRTSVKFRSRWNAVEAQYKDLLPVYERYKELKQALENHDIAIVRDRAEKRLYDQMIKEAKIYERLIINKWTRLGFCHRYREGNRNYVDEVSFSKVGITLDAIYFKIATSSQTMFKNWKTDIPDHVRVTTQLLAPETLDELSITCQRQVTGQHSPAGAWVIVHRLDSVDGLMNYVAYGDVMERYPYSVHHKVPICIGVGLNREVKWVNLGDFPQWLIGGFTGSGKSNFVNAGICTMISQHTPEDLRLVLIDLKGGLEFDAYKDLPHLHGSVVDSVAGVADMMAEVEAIMKDRFRKFRGITKLIDVYRALKPNEPMPRLVVIFDEVASIMDHGETTKRILASMREIARQGRAVGVHLWLCTQRPDVEAIAGSIKANLNVRISGRMTTSQDSITVLGTSAAKDLAAIPGRMVLQLGPDPEPVQTPHITEDDIAASIRIALQHQRPAPLDVPEGARVIHQEWTIERVIELSLKHLDGNITFTRVYKAADDLSKSQARDLVEKVWELGTVEFEGKRYQVVTGSSNTRTLVELEPEFQNDRVPDASIGNSGRNSDLDSE